jgi:hypothetical protein
LNVPPAPSVLKNTRASEIPHAFSMSIQCPHKSIASNEDCDSEIILNFIYIYSC